MKFHLIILFSLLFVFGCVKNTISIHVKPDGDFDLDAKKKRKVFEFNRKYYRFLNNSAARALR